MPPVPDFILTVLALVLAAAIGGTLVLYFIWYYERQNGSTPREMPGASRGMLNPLVGAPALALESMALATLLATYPLRLLHDVTPFRARARGETPVLLVHGWGANSSCFLAIQAWLKLRGYRNVYAISYTPPVIRAEKLARQVARDIDRALAATGATRVDIVAHSMGGLLTRYAIRNLGMDGKIGTVVTLGSPHRGSKIAGIVPGGGNVPQMRYESEFVRKLEADGMTPGKHVQYFSIYSEFDNFVLPSHSSVLDGDARNIHVAWHGHCALLYSPVVFRLIEQCLEAGRAGVGETA